jgi:hypothetical protein
MDNKAKDTASKSTPANTSAQSKVAPTKPKTTLELLEEDDEFEVKLLML